MLKSQAEFLQEIVAQFCEPYAASCGIGPEAEKWASKPKAFKNRAASLFARIRDDAAMAQYGGPFHPAPENIITRDLWELAVQVRGSNLSYVPVEKRDENMCHIAVVESKPHATLRYVPEEHRTEAICLAAIRNGNSNFHGIPEHFANSSEFCERAIEANPAALEGVPESLKSRPLCYMALEEALRKGRPLSEIIDFVPARYIDMSFCRFVARLLLTNTSRVNNIWKLKEFLPTVRHGYSTNVFFEQDAIGALYHTYRHIQPETERECIEEMKHEAFPTFLFIPDELMTDSVRLAACETDGLCLAFIELEARTEPICLAAVKSCAKAIDAVPDNVLNTELCLAAVTTHKGALQYVPMDQRTDEVCFSAVEFDPDNVTYAPKDFLARAVSSYQNEQRSPQ